MNIKPAKWMYISLDLYLHFKNHQRFQHHDFIVAGDCEK